MYDEQSVLVAEPGKPVQGLDNIKQALTGFLALKLPIQLTVRHVYENGDIGFCTADWSIAGKAPDGKDVKVGGTSVEVVKKTSGGNWIYVIDSPYGTARLSPPFRLAPSMKRTWRRAGCCRLKLAAQRRKFFSPVHFCLRGGAWQ